MPVGDRELAGDVEGVGEVVTLQSGTVQHSASGLCSTQTSPPQVSRSKPVSGEAVTFKLVTTPPRMPPPHTTQTSSKMTSSAQVVPPNAQTSKTSNSPSTSARDSRVEKEDINEVEELPGNS